MKQSEIISITHRFQMKQVANFDNRFIRCAAHTFGQCVGKCAVRNATDFGKLAHTFVLSFDFGFDKLRDLIQCISYLSSAIDIESWHYIIVSPLSENYNGF